MAGQRRPIGHDDMASQDAIVGNVRTHHEKIMIADSRVRAATQCASMNVDVLAKLIVRTDGQKGLFTMEFQILGLNADHAKRKKAIGGSDYCRPFYDDMGIQLTIIANRNVVAYAAIWANLDCGANHGSGRNDGSGVNCHSVRAATASD